MALTKRTENKLEIQPNGVVQVRTATVIEEDGVDIATNYHRKILLPNQDVTAEAAEIQAVCAAVWTTEKVAAYEASVVPEDQQLEYLSKLSI